MLINISISNNFKSFCSAVYLFPWENQGSLTRMRIFSKWWHLFCSSVSQEPSPQVRGGAELPDILHQTWGILRWKRSSAAERTVSETRSPRLLLSQAFLIVCKNKQFNIHMFDKHNDVGNWLQIVLKNTKVFLHSGLQESSAPFLLKMYIFLWGENLCLPVCFLIKLLRRETTLKGKNLPFRSKFFL